jgi:hypothetical protein
MHHAFDSVQLKHFEVSNRIIFAMKAKFGRRHKRRKRKKELKHIKRKRKKKDLQET